MGVTVTQEGRGISSFLICISNLTCLKRNSSLLHQTCTSTGAPDSPMTFPFRDRRVSLLFFSVLGPHTQANQQISLILSCKAQLYSSMPTEHTLPSSLRCGFSDHCITLQIGSPASVAPRCNHRRHPRDKSFQDLSLLLG